MPPTLNKFQQNSCSYYSPTNYSTCYPFKEIQRQTIIQTNSLEVIDKYLNIYITQYNNKSSLSGTILFGFDLKCLKRRQIDNQNQSQKYVELNLNGLLVRLQNIESKKPKPFQYLDSIVHACDKFLITCNGYRQLAAIMPNIEFQVGSIIPNGAYRSFKDILHIIVSKLAYNNLPVLQIGDIIHIKLSGDS
ncbi:4019_t:CDS:2 [Dentiscutata erythropus]|uniref:4019_t:CDS:1 n=1 Tax=Dentiscutata erythropus TaxID=1348616 RepID=A0A9N8Z8G7_9GLOM|nr:4019_t:CDS:2 [Dentiscutata erythropus]